MLFAKGDDAVWAATPRRLARCFKAQCEAGRMYVKLHRDAATAAGGGDRVTADSLFICFPHETDCHADRILSRVMKSAILQTHVFLTF